MGFNFVVPINLIFEAVLVSLQACAITFHQDTIDAVFLGVIATYFLFSIVWLFYLKKPGRKFQLEIRIFRGLQGLAIIIIGGILIYDSKAIEDPVECFDIESSLGIECRKFVPKLVIGILAILNALVYFINPCRQTCDSNNNKLEDVAIEDRNNKQNAGSHQIFGYTIGRQRSDSSSTSRKRSQSVPSIWQNNPYLQHNPNEFYQKRRSINIHCPPGNNKYNVYMPFGAKFQPRQSVDTTVAAAAVYPSQKPVSMATALPFPVKQPKRHSYVGDGLGIGGRQGQGFDQSPAMSNYDKYHT